LSDCGFLNNPEEPAVHLIVRRKERPVVDPGTLATVASVVAGFGVAMLFFRIQRELQIREKVEPQWIPWADRLLIGATLASVLLVLLPVLAFPQQEPALRTAVAVCAGLAILIAGYVFGILAHYRLVLGRHRNTTHPERENPEPAERVIVLVSLVLALFVVFGVFITASPDKPAGAANPMALPPGVSRTMDWSATERFFNNQSVGAFFGAFAAFVLVMLNDWRRDLRKVRNLRAEVEMNLADAQAKLETVRSNRSLMREHNQVVPAPILNFNTTLIRSMTADVLSRLSMDQRRALEAVCYFMEATDELLLGAYNIAKEFGTHAEPTVRLRNAEHLLNESAMRLITLSGYRKCAETTSMASSR